MAPASYHRPIEATNRDLTDDGTVALLNELDDTIANLPYLLSPTLE